MSSRLFKTMASTTPQPRGFYSSDFWSDYLLAQRNKLPLLPDVDEGLSDRLVRFLAGNPGDMQLQGTNTYLVGTGSTRILIDTGEGFPLWAINIIQYLEDHDICLSDILLTHHHKDHTGGVADLLAHDARIKVHKKNPNHGQYDIADGQVFCTQGATLRAVLTPGHTADHTCFVLHEDDALFTGDNVLGHGFSVAENLGTYTASLHRMANCGCAIGYPGHGAVIQNLPTKLGVYINQRVSREEQVYDTLVQRALTGSLRSGRSSSASSSISDSGSDSGSNEMGCSDDGLSITDIVEHMYGDIFTDKATFDVALKPIISQVLLMLAERGKVGSRLVGLENTRHWFARIKRID